MIKDQELNLRKLLFDGKYVLRKAERALIRLIPVFSVNKDCVICYLEYQYYTIKVMHYHGLVSLEVYSEIFMHKACAHP